LTNDDCDNAFPVSALMIFKAQRPELTGAPLFGASESNDRLEREGEGATLQQLAKLLACKFAITQNLGK
jgi:hypothetical protein